jgi:hypothetical protein
MILCLLNFYILCTCTSYSAHHIKWARMYIYVKLALYWNNFEPEKDPLSVLLLWLVLGGVPLPSDDVLQPPGHELHQVSQGLSWVNFEFGGVPLNNCQKKVFQLRIMKIGQNMHKIHTDTKKKTSGQCEFQGQWYWIFKIFSSQKFSVI